MRPAEHPHFNDDEIDALFAPLAGASCVALAVSGGPDSLALLLLMERWCAGGARPAIHVLTVDHRLHPRSAQDAAFVARLATERGFAARILVRGGAAPRTGIEAAARSVRYRLLIDAAREIGASHIVLAHHRDDQAETFLMRLGRGSGVHGLAAMRPISVREGVMLFRPFLDIPKVRLAAVARAAGVEPVDDAANRDPRFLRTKLRALLPDLARAGLDAERLADMARQMALIADAIDAEASALLADTVAVDAFAVARLDAAGYGAAPEAVRLRALTRLLQAIGGGTYPPRGERLAALDAVLAGDAARSFRRTLAGTVIERAGEMALFYREGGRTGLPVIEVGDAFDGTWDHRFRLAIRNRGGDAVAIGPLGAADARRVGGAARRSPTAALAALPSIRLKDRLISVPALDYGPDGAEGLAVAAASLLDVRVFGPRLREATVH